GWPQVPTFTLVTTCPVRSPMIGRPEILIARTDRNAWRADILRDPGRFPSDFAAGLSRRQDQRLAGCTAGAAFDAGACSARHLVAPTSTDGLESREDSSHSARQGAPGASNGPSGVCCAGRRFRLPSMDGVATATSGPNFVRSDLDGVPCCSV